MLGGKERAEQLNKQQKTKVDKKFGGYTVKEDKQEIGDIRKYYKPRRGDPDYNRGTGGRSGT